MVKQLINVICATYNQSKELKKTIQSFNEQEHIAKRLIIIDGASSDGIVEIIAGYRDDIDYFISEVDRGISDAFNKGLAQCQPGYVYFLGAGDTFINSKSLCALVEECNYQEDWLVCGKVRRKDVDSGDIIGILPKSLKFNKKSLLLRMSLPHQGLLTSTCFFDKYGVFREECKFAMDYELLLRAYKSFPKVVMKDIIVADWLSGGVGQDRTLDVFTEYDEIKRLNKVAPVMILSFLDKWIRLKYKIKCLITK